MADKPIPTITPIIEDRFWRRVDRSDGQGPHGDCWLWTGSFGYGGYPRGVSINGVQYRAGQISLLIAGQHPDDVRVWALHSCDNPACVRADHLRWGSPKENIADACERGTGGRRGFTPDEIRYIRSSPKRLFELAAEFSTSSACISNIRTRITHKHVE